LECDELIGQALVPLDGSKVLPWNVTQLTGFLAYDSWKLQDGNTGDIIFLKIK
jgi:hypothetical protein